MRIPKLTKPRFFLLWGVGVVIFFLISWRTVFSPGKNVPGGRHALDEWKVHNHALMPVFDGNIGLPDAKLNDQRAARPPSSIVDAMNPNKVVHQDQKDQNTKDLKKPDGKSSQSVFPAEDETSKSSDQSPNHLDHDVSFLRVPHQEMDDSRKFSSKDTSKAIDDSQEVHGEAAPESIPQSSYVLSQEQIEAGAERPKSIKTGLFEEENTYHHPPDALLRDADRNVAQMSHERQNPHQPPSNPPKGRSGEVGLDAAQSTGAGSRSGKAISLAPKVSPQDGTNDDANMPDGEQTHFEPRQGAPHGVPHEGTVTKVDVVDVDSRVGPANARDTPLINGKYIHPQLNDPHLVESNIHVVYNEQKQTVPTFGTHDARRNEVAVSLAEPIERAQHNGGVQPLPPKIEEGFLREGDGRHQLPSQRLNRENARVGSVTEKTANSADKFSNSAGRVGNLPSVINQSVRSSSIDRRPPVVNTLSKDRVHISESRTVLQNAAKPDGGVEFRRPKEPALSAEVQERSNKGTGMAIPPENETEEQFLQRMEEVQRERHARVQQQCQSRYNLTPLDFQRDRQKILSWKKYYEHAYANQDHQFIICRELKAASFSWRKVMISLYAKGSPSFRRSQKQGDFPMMDYDDDTFMSKLSSYKKILFVREPFARFLSAYRDKYVELRHFPYYQPIGMNIIRKYRKNPTQAQIRSGRPTFEEFTRWVITEEVPEGDYHWRPLFNWYHPCEIPYDYIGKVETAVEDTRYIFKMVGIDNLETFPSTETHHKFSSSADVLKQFYSQLSPDLLPLLIKRYKQEFELFDYPIPQRMSDIWTKR